MWWRVITGMFGGDILGKVRDVAEVFVGNRKDRDRNEHDEQIAIHREHENTFSYRVKNRSYFDIFVDGLNRLPRPMMTFGVMWLIVWAAWSPYEFSIAMEALSSIPEWMATVITCIVVFFFGSRSIASAIPRQVAEGRARRTTRVGGWQTDTEPAPPTSGPKSYDTVSTENSVIDEWRRRQMSPGD